MAKSRGVIKIVDTLGTVSDKPIFLERKWVKFVFSVSIILSAVPSIYQDLTYGHQGEWTHYGMMLIGLLYFTESLLWVLDIWKK